MGIRVNDLADLTPIIQNWVKELLGSGHPSAVREGRLFDCFEFTTSGVELIQVTMIIGGGVAKKHIFRSWREIETYLKEKGLI